MRCQVLDGQLFLAVPGRIEIRAGSAGTAGRRELVTRRAGESGDGLAHGTVHGLLVNVHQRGKRKPEPIRQDPSQDNEAQAGATLRAGAWPRSSDGPINTDIHIAI